MHFVFNWETKIKAARPDEELVNQYRMLFIFKLGEAKRASRSRCRSGNSQNYLDKKAGEENPCRPERKTNGGRPTKARGIRGHVHTPAVLFNRQGIQETAGTKDYMYTHTVLFNRQGKQETAGTKDYMYTHTVLFNRQGIQETAGTKDYMYTHTVLFNRQGKQETAGTKDYMHTPAVLFNRQGIQETAGTKDYNYVRSHSPFQQMDKAQGDRREEKPRPIRTLPVFQQTSGTRTATANITYPNPPTPSQSHSQTHRFQRQLVTRTIRVTAGSSGVSVRVPTRLMKLTSARLCGRYKNAPSDCKDDPEMSAPNLLEQGRGNTETAQPGKEEAHSSRSNREALHG